MNANFGQTECDYACRDADQQALDCGGGIFSCRRGGVAVCAGEIFPCILYYVPRQIMRHPCLEMHPALWNLWPPSMLLLHFSFRREDWLRMRGTE